MKQNRKFWGMAAGLLLTTSTAWADAPLKPDKGKFLLMIQETPVGSDTFTSDANGGSECDTVFEAAGQKIKQHLSLNATAGRVKSISISSTPGGKATLTLVGAKGKLTAPGLKTPQSRILPARLLPFANFAPHTLANLLAAYDAKRGGPQVFDVLILDSLTPIKMTLNSSGAKSRRVGGKTVPVSRYSLLINGQLGATEIEVYADSDGRVLMWNVPGQKYVAVRVGYQDLTKPDTPADPTLSPPKYEIKKETNVRVKMRDGIALATDVYRPNAPGKFPVILQRTPYGRDKAFEGNYWAKRGYVFVAQDVRGKFDSEGEWHPFVNEARDGHDAVDWCAVQPWSTGDVGMIGGSYLGFVQWAAAQEGNPHLKALIPIVSPPDPFFNIPYAYGALFLSPDLWWASAVDGKGFALGPTLKKLDGYKTLPLTDVDKAVFGKHIPAFQEWLKHPTNDAYWQQASFNAKMATMPPIPALHVSGWFDGDGIGTKRNYAAMVESGHEHQKLVYGPWEHAVNSTSKIADLDFGAGSLRDLDTLYLRWFDHWLKGVKNGIEAEAPVDAFLMGRNEWRSFSAWPPKEAVITQWYLRSEGKANGAGGNGKLTLETPPSAEAADHYTYDPATPYIPSSLEKMANTGESPTSLFSRDDAKENVLVYVSEPLKEDVVVAGPISLHLWAASSAKDTDWYADLNDVGTDGKLLGLCQGIIRARFRNSFAKPTLLTPGEPNEYTLDLWATGNVFKKGHRIRVGITSSFFPLYDRNLNTGEDIATGTRMVIAQQTVLHDKDHASYLVLPTLPK